jgi:hypothetical protein
MVYEHNDNLDINNKLDGNKKLINNKNLCINSMSSMSIDDIIDKYRQGYALEENPYSNIKSMSASPSFSYVSATHGPNYIMAFIALVFNSGSRGVVRLKAFNKTSGNCVEDMSSDHCIEASYNQYIPSGLYSLVAVVRYSGSVFYTGCLGAYICSSGEVCDPPTCSTYNTSSSAFSNNISVDTGAGVDPDTVTNYILTPGNGTITANWTEPNNTSIFAYLIILTRISDNVILAIGYIRGPIVHISNLTNGTQYSVRVVPISYDYYVGNGTTLTATPVIPAPILASITLTTPLPSINIGMTEAITAVCRDTTTAIMTCPTLTWTSSTGAVTFDSPGVVRGASAGTSTIRATKDSIYGEVVVTVNANPAIIAIQSITVGGISCPTECSVTCITTCPAIVDIVVTWTNSGGSNGTFTPTVTVTPPGTTVNGAQITVAASSGTGSTTFAGVSLQHGSPNVCIDTGTITSTNP